MAARDRRHLSDRDEAAAPCPTCGQPVASADAYLPTAELPSYQPLGKDKCEGAGYLVIYHGRSVLDADMSRATMPSNLQLPSGREGKPYVPRHSLATILRHRDVAKRDIEGFMGRDAGSTTEVPTIGRFDTVGRALRHLREDRCTQSRRSAPKLGRICAEVALSGSPAGVLKMTG